MLKLIRGEYRAIHTKERAGLKTFRRREALLAYSLSWKALRCARISAGAICRPHVPLSLSLFRLPSRVCWLPPNRASRALLGISTLSTLHAAIPRSRREANQHKAHVVHFHRSSGADLGVMVPALVHPPLLRDQARSLASLSTKKALGTCLFGGVCIFIFVLLCRPCCSLVFMIISDRGCLRSLFIFVGPACCLLCFSLAAR